VKSPRASQQSLNAKPAAIAIGAHPDDIEFYMAGTLLLLKRAGFEIHYMNLSSGNCGSLQHDAASTRAIRRKESKRAAQILAAHYHPSLTDDLEILYELKSLRRLAAIIREVKPSILLTHPPQDYMEDHTNTCRLAVTAAFSRGMPNFKTIPARTAIDNTITVYHAMPHGLQDGLRRTVIPGAFVDTTAVHAAKRDALAAHRSQKEWLDVSQGMDSYLHVMDEMSLAVGRLSRRFEHAEGWRRHLHHGFCGFNDDPLCDALKEKYLINPVYERSLRRAPAT
jgi:LmbE family N-acetylglucosaminyl deacetylase